MLLFPALFCGDADCHVASLLAMTCRNLRRVCVCQGALPGKSIGRYEFALSTAYFYPSLRGSGLPRRFAPRNDMQKIVALLRVQEGAAGASPQPPTNSPQFHPFAPAKAPLPSAFHRAPRPCTRRRVSVFCMSLRTSAHTGVAIRFPAEMPGKSVVLRANS